MSRCYSTFLVRSRPAETVEFSVACASEKRMPFVRRKSKNRPFGVPAVANADAAIGQARHLDAVAVGETQRALNPVRTETRPFGWTSECRSSHVTTSLIVGYYPRCATTECSLDPTYRSHSTLRLADITGTQDPFHLK